MGYNGGDHGHSKGLQRPRSSIFKGKYNENGSVYSSVLYKNLGEYYDSTEKGREASNRNQSWFKNNLRSRFQQFNRYYGGRTKDAEAPLKDSAKRVRQMASNELDAELQLLITWFDISKTQAHGFLNDLESAKGGNFQDYSRYLSVFNQCLNFRDKFQWTINLIQREYNKTEKDGKTTKKVSKQQGNSSMKLWYGSNFKQEWKEQSKKCAKDINKAIKANPNITREELANIFEDHIVICREKALQSALGVQDLSGKTNISPYHDLQNLIINFESSPQVQQFKSSLFATYGLDTLKDELADFILNQEQMHITATDLRGQVNYGGEAQLNGIAEEVVATLTQSASKGDFNDFVKSFQTGAFGGGAARIKPDIITVFGEGMTDVVEKYLTDLSHVRVSRDAFVKAANELSETLSHVPGEFLVYTNAKMSADSDRFKERHGFSAGEAITAQRWIQIGGDPLPVNGLIQLIDGAYGHELEGFETAVKNAFAEQIATFLFDDFRVIVTTSSEMAGSGKSIHVLDLDGIYIPLSIFLSQLADALDNWVQQASTAPGLDQLVHISFSTPAKVLYPNAAETNSYNPNESLYGNDTPEQAWQKQRIDAYANSKISARFYAGLFDMIRKTQF